MRTYNNLLAVVEPKRTDQVAFKRAMEMANINSNAKITLLRVIYDYSFDLHGLTPAKALDTRDQVFKTHERELEAMIESLRGDCKAPIQSKIAFATDIGIGILTELEQGDYDLLIKAANHHGVLDSLIFTPIDWFLLRNAHVPVIIAKEHPWLERNNIVICMDFSLNSSSRTNIALLREAQILAALTRGNIHLVSCAPVVMPALMMEAPHYAPEIYAQSILNEHRRRLDEFAQNHGIDPYNCHVLEGMPDDMIPQLCSRLNASTVFIGSAGRSGIAAALVGNTCEKIVDYIDSDLVVLNAKTIKEKGAKAQ